MQSDLAEHESEFPLVSQEASSSPTLLGALQSLAHPCLSAYPLLPLLHPPRSFLFLEHIKLMCFPLAVLLVWDALPSDLAPAGFSSFRCPLTQHSVMHPPSTQLSLGYELDSPLIYFLSLQLECKLNK